MQNAFQTKENTFWLKMHSVWIDVYGFLFFSFTFLYEAMPVGVEKFFKVCYLLVKLNTLVCISDEHTMA